MAAVERVLSEALQGSLDTFAKDIASDLKARLRATLSEHRALTAEFAARLHFRWFEGLDLFEAILIALSEIGYEMNDEVRSESGTGVLAEVLTIFQARGVRIGREVLCLLLQGYPDGAMARWCSAHEISVLSFFLSAHGDQLAERFLSFAEVERYQEMQTFNRHAKTLGYPGVDGEEIADVTSRYETVKSRYEKGFCDSYGWVGELLPDRRRNFRGIEENVGLDHLRPFYLMASRSIHTSPKGLYWDLGMTDATQSRVMLAGPSNYGLADPAQNTAISLLQITTNLFMLRPSVTRLAGLKAVELLSNEMSLTLVEAQMQIQQEEACEQNGSA